MHLAHSIAIDDSDLIWDDLCLSRDKLNAVVLGHPLFARLPESLEYLRNTELIRLTNAVRLI